MAGGSGRGNKGHSVIQDDARPDCPACGGFMKSNAKKWRCTDPACDKSISKRIATMFNQQLKEVFNWGFDTEKATLHARRCETGNDMNEHVFTYWRWRACISSQAGNHIKAAMFSSFAELERNMYTKPDNVYMN